ncbi:MAG: hypothetical protein Q4D04_01695 [Clostridia bacterium]|nr:hypothetical protein [Clostridia bacterium]
MNGRGFRIGPGAASLMLIVLVLCMSIVGILAFVSAVGDVKLSERSAEMTREYYAADGICSQRLAALDAALLKAEYNAVDDEAYIREITSSLGDEYHVDGREVTLMIDAKYDRHILCRAFIYTLGEGPGGARYGILEHSLTDDMEWEEEYLDLFGG